MLVDLTGNVKNLRGGDMYARTPDGQLVKSTLADEVAAIIAVLPTERNLPGAQRRSRFDLSIRIMQAKGPIELTPEEISLVIREIEKTEMSPAMYGQVVAALDGKPNPLAAEEGAPPPPPLPLTLVPQSPAMNGRSGA